MTEMICSIPLKIKIERNQLFEQLLDSVGLQLMVDKQEFFNRLDWLVSRAGVMHSRSKAIKKATHAARFAKELQRALNLQITHIAGFQNVDLAIQRLKSAGQNMPPRPNWKKFIARDCGQLYCFAFHTKPGRSQSVDKNGNNKYSGPFVEFCWFVINCDVEKEARARATILDDIGDKNTEIEKVWNRFEATRALKQGFA